LHNGTQPGTAVGYGIVGFEANNIIGTRAACWMAFYADQLTVFGGFGRASSNSSSGNLGDLWAFDVYESQICLK